MGKKQLESVLTSVKEKSRAWAAALKQTGKSIDWRQAEKFLNTGASVLKHTSAASIAAIKSVIREGRQSEWLRQNKPVALAGSCLVLVSMMGIYSFINIDKNIFGPKQVDFIAETTAAKEALAVDQPTLSNISNVNPARRIGVSGYGIFANGRAVGFAASEAEANQILDALKKTYAAPGATETWFVETVAVKPSRQDIVEFNGARTLEEAVQQIARGTSQRQEHMIQQGENLWLIAKKFNMSMDTLIAANPGIDAEKVKINQKISLVVPKPLISVASKEVKEYNDAIPFEVVYEESSGIYKGESTVKRAGVQGERFVKAEIIRINGKEVERKILEEKISKNPIGKIIVKGTKNPPPKIGSGKFIRPTSRGLLTSRFGGRWGRMHEGIDIGLPIGSPIKASDGGRVTFSGYRNGYGYCVIIDHGSGLSTLYGHNSQLLVKKGQSVFQGQVIAKSGNSGRSTGPHLHFEVLKHGNPVNPLGFVKY